MGWGNEDRTMTLLELCDKLKITLNIERNIGKDRSSFYIITLKNTAITKDKPYIGRGHSLSNTVLCGDDVNKVLDELCLGLSGSWVTCFSTNELRGLFVKEVGIGGLKVLGVDSEL